MADTILLVEDDRDTMLFLKTVLMNEGYEVVEAFDGNAGMEALRKQNPDLVCLDLALPKKSGVDLLREMNRDKRLRTIPVVVVSGFASPNANNEDLQALVDGGFVKGPDDYIEKPIDTFELFQKIEKALDS